MRMLLVVALVFFALVWPVGPSAAASTPDGAIVVRVDDGVGTQCINMNSDLVSLHLRRMIVDRDSGFFSSDKEVGLVLGTTVMGTSQGETKQVSFPRMFKTNIEDFSPGVVALPIEMRIFHQFKLMTSADVFDGVELKFTVLKKKKKDNFGLVLEALTNITKNLPLPPNPYVQAFQFFAGFANGIVDQSIADANNLEPLPGGQIALAFTTGNCTQDFETTGTLAVVRGSNGKESDGFADIKKQYCWAADLKPVFTLKFAPRPANGSCAGATSFATVRNAYLGFVLNAQPALKAGINLSGVNSAIAQAAARCARHGLAGSC